MGNPVVKNYIDPISGELVIGGEIQINGTMTGGEDATADRHGPRRAQRGLQVWAA